MATIQCVDINKLYNISCYDKKRKYIALHISVALPFTLTLWEENVVLEENVVTAPNDGNAQNVAQPKLRSATLTNRDLQT